MLRSPRSILVLRGSLAVLTAMLAFAAPAMGDRADSLSRRYDAVLDSTLHARNPAAQELFRQANAARESGESLRAIDLYTQVLGRLPDFTPAVRRRALEWWHAGGRARAITELEMLLQRDSTAYNHSALALVLMLDGLGRDASPTFYETRTARDHALQAIALDPDDLMGWQACWLVAGHEQDTTLMRRALLAVRRLRPGDPQTAHAELWYQIDVVRDSRAASVALERAIRLELSQESVAEARAAIHELRAHERSQRLVALAGWSLAGWLAAFFVLYLVGAGLSRLTLRAAGAALADPSGRAVGLSGRLRRLYRAVLWLSCAYYYVSIPLVLLLVIGLGGGLVYMTFAVGHVPIKLVVIVVGLTLVTVASILRSLLVRGRDEDPGIRLDLGAFPRLREVLARTAERIGTRAVDTVFATAGAELAVFERGGLRSQLGGHAERCLILGIGVLDGMTIGQLKAVLAHEYGHFSNRDTAGGGFALSVRRSLYTMAMHLAQGGAAGWYNPAWQFLRAFHAMFMRISQGASRLQEVLADRWAAVTCGSAEFVAGLRHVIEASVRFDAHANAAVNEALKEQRPLTNLYRFATTTPEAAAAESEIESDIAKALDAEPSEYDSHPTPRQRFAWVDALAIVVELEPGDAEDAWSLFPDRESMERLLTERLREGIEQAHDVKFATADA